MYQLWLWCASSTGIYHSYVIDWHTDQVMIQQRLFWSVQLALVHQDREVCTLFRELKYLISTVPLKIVILRHDILTQWKFNICYMYMWFVVGRLMRLTYFATPYELADIKHPGQDLKFSNESKFEFYFVYSLKVGLTWCLKNVKIVLLLLSTFKSTMANR